MDSGSRGLTEHVRETCRIGQAEACCRYLIVGRRGFECAKLDPSTRVVRHRGVPGRLAPEREMNMNDCLRYLKRGLRLVLYAYAFWMFDYQVYVIISAPEDMILTLWAWYLFGSGLFALFLAVALRGEHRFHAEDHD